MKKLSPLYLLLIFIFCAFISPTTTEVFSNLGLNKNISIENTRQTKASTKRQDLQTASFVDIATSVTTLASNRPSTTEQSLSKSKKESAGAIRLLLILMISLFLVIIAIIAWRKTLRKAIEKRTKEIEKSVETISQYTTQENTTLTKYQHQLKDTTKHHTKEISQSEKDLIEAQSIAHIGNITVDTRDKSSTWSSEIYNILDIEGDKERKQLKHYMKLVHSDDRKSFTDIFEEGLKNGEPYEITHRIITAKGEEKHILLRGGKTNDSLKKTIITIQDITNKRRAELELESQRNLSLAALQLTNSAAWHIDIKRFPNRIYPSPGLLTLLGVSLPDDMNYISIDQWKKERIDINGQVGEDLIANLEKGIRGEISNTDITYKVIRKNDGKEIWLRTKGILTTDKYGTPAYLNGVTQDITEQVISHEKINSSEKRLNTALSSANIGLWDKDLTTGDLYINDVWKTMLGYHAEDPNVQASATLFRNLLHPNSVRKVDAEMQRIKNKTTQKYAIEVQVLAANGKYKWIRSIGNIIERKEDGTPLRMLGIHIDITDEKAQNHELLNSKIRLESLFENMSTGFAEYEIILDAKNKPTDFRYTYTNPAFRKITGLNIDVLGKKFSEVNPHADKIWIERFGKVALTGEASTTEDYVSHYEKYFKTYAFSNKRGHFAVLFSDITEQKKEQIKLEISETRLSQVIEVGRLGTFEIDIETKSAEANEITYQLLEIEKSDEPGNNLNEVISNIAPEYQEKINEAIKNTVDSNINIIEFKYISPKTGTEKWYQVNSRIISRDHDGSNRKIIGFLHDLTERKTAEELIIKANKKTNEALDIAKAGSWYHDYKTNPGKYYVDQRMKNLLGTSSLTNHEYITIEDFTANILKANRNAGEHLLVSLNECLMNSSENSFNGIFQFYNEERKKAIWLRIMAHITRDENGKLIYSSGILQDINELKQVEEKLQRVNKLSDNALRLTKSGFWHIDYNEPDYYYPSDKVIEILGEKPKKNNKYHLMDEWHSRMFEVDDKLAFNAINDYQQAVDYSSEFDFTYKYKRPIDGRIIWVRSIGEMIKNEDGEIQYMYGVSQDITATKQYEQSIKVSKQRTEALLRVSELEITSLDDFFKKTLKEMKRLSSSNKGYIFNYNTQKQAFENSEWALPRQGQALNNELLAQINATENHRNLINANAGVIVNTHKDDSSKLKRWMCVPITSNGKIVALVAVVNKEEIYTNNDLRELTLMTSSVWKMVDKYETAAKLLKTKADLDTAISAAKMGTWEWDCINDKLTLGKKAEKLAGKNIRKISEWYNIVHEEDKEMFKRFMRRITKAKKEDFSLSFRIKNPQKEKIIHVVCAGKITYGGLDKEAISISGILWNINKIKKNEDRAKRSQTHIRQVLNSVPIGVAITDDKTGKYIFMNNTIKEMLEINNDDFSRLREEKIFKNSNDLRHVVQQLENSNNIINKEFELIKTKSKEPFWAQVTIARSNFFDTKTNLICLYDFTETKELQIDIENARQKAETANVAKSAFLANMSHEIRTPMNAIIGFSNILQKRIDDPVNNEFLKSISVSGKTLVGLINDILDFSKIEAGKFSINERPTNLQKTVEEISLMFDLKAQEKNLGFKTLVDKDVPRFLMLDELRIKQVLINLVGNALKFTLQGSVSIHVYSQQVDDNYDITIKVIDTGIGISKDEHKQIFEAFKQKDQQDNRTYGGTGLGLSISSSLVELMGSKIEIESTLEEGSTFFFTIKDVAKTTQDHSLLEEIEELDNVIFKNNKVLIVDDLEDNHLVVEGILETKNLTLLHANSAKSGLEIMEDKLPDLVLMDIKMPEMDGFEALNIIRNTPKLAKTKVVALSASIIEKDNPEWAPFDGSIAKPIDEQELIKTLMSFLPNDIGLPHQETHTPVDDDRLRLLKRNRGLMLKIHDQCDEAFSNYKNRKSNKNLTYLVEKLTDVAKQKEYQALDSLAKDLKIANESFNIERLEELEIVLTDFFSKR